MREFAYGADNLQDAVAAKGLEPFTEIFACARGDSRALFSGAKGLILLNNAVTQDEYKAARAAVKKLGMALSGQTPYERLLAKTRAEVLPGS